MRVGSFDGEYDGSMLGTLLGGKEGVLLDNFDGSNDYVRHSDVGHKDLQYMMSSQHRAHKDLLVDMH